MSLNIMSMDIDHNRYAYVVYVHGARDTADGGSTYVDLHTEEAQVEYFVTWIEANHRTLEDKLEVLSVQAEEFRDARDAAELFSMALKNAPIEIF